MLGLLPFGATSTPLASGPDPAPAMPSPRVEFAMLDVQPSGRAARCEIGPTRPPAAWKHHREPVTAAPATRHPHVRVPAEPHAPGPPATHVVYMPAVSTVAAHASHDAGGCHPTPAQQAAADKLVTDVRRVLKQRFDLPEKAVLEGYRRGPNESEQNIHYFDPEEQGSPTVLDPNHPEGVVYRGREVIGAVFMMPMVGDRGPQPGGCLTTWHSHVDEKSGERSPEAIHVWIVPRPGGPFGH
jgi:hypothetical protein